MPVDPNAPVTDAPVETAPLMPPPDYVENPDYLQGGVDSGVGGKQNFEGNLGIDPSMLDSSREAWENSPWANQNYDVNAGKSRAFTREAKQNEMSAYQLEKMLASDSPLMQRARSQAMAGAGGRGLMNSSIAQGSAMGSMIDRAQPFALQDAASNSRAATESLAAQNSSSQQNAQLDTQAGIAGMQARSQRDQQLLAGELGVKQDFLRAALAMETREDQQAFQDSQNRFAEQFKWSSDRQQAVERWSEGEFKLLMQQDMTREQGMAQIAGLIFNNKEMTGPEQLAAWARAQQTMNTFYDEREGSDGFEPQGPTWGDPGYVRPPVNASSQGYSTQPYITEQNRKINHATGQVYKSDSNPTAATVTESLPPIL